MRCCDVEKLWMTCAMRWSPPHASYQTSARMPAMPGALRTVRRYRILPDVLAPAGTLGNARAENHRPHPHRRKGDVAG